jgi:hypothetical protein
MAKDAEKVLRYDLRNKKVIATSFPREGDGGNLDDACMICRSPIGPGHGNYYGKFCSSCGSRISIIKAVTKTLINGFTTGELWEDIAAIVNRPPRKEYIPTMLRELGYVEANGVWMPLYGLSK